MVITTGKSRKDINWQNKRVSWQTLCARLARPTRTSETLQEYQSMSKDDKGKIKDVGGFVGGEIKDGRRTKNNVVSRCLVTLDADYASKDSIELAEMLTDYQMCVYSTHSHTQKNPRLRFVIPMTRDVTPAEYEPIARQVALDLGIDQFDVTTYDTCRLMYWPSVSADGQFIFKEIEGETLDPDEMLSRYEDWRDTTEWPLSSQETSIRVKQAKEQGDPTTKPGLIGLFCRTYDIDSAISEFLPEIYEPCGERYTYADGSTSGGAVTYQGRKFLYSHHSTDPVCGILCNAFDLVRLHLFGDLDATAKPDCPVTQLPSYKAMTNLVSSDAKCKETLVAEQESEAREVFSKEELEEEESDDTSWTEKLTINKNGAVEATIENIVIVLEHDKRLKGKLAQNLFTNRLSIIDDLPWHRCEDHINGDMWSDMDDSSLRMYIEKIYRISAKDKVTDAINVVMQRHAFHPVRDYLNSLTWDGECRAEDIFVKFFGADNTDYVKAVTRKWLTAAVSRVMHPGCKFDNMIVLVGTQGIGKSYFGKLIGKHWYSDTFNTLGGKEAYEQLKGAWILEMGELSVMKKAEVESVKMFISKQEDNYRSAYGRHVTSNKRQCIFYGTTNDDSFLRDRTGNRRFWPIGCHPELAENDVFDLTDRDIDQMWAEVMHWYKSDETLYLTKEQTALAVIEQEKYTTEDPRLGAVEAYLDTPIPIDWEDMSKTDRRNFIQGFMTYDGETMTRTNISVVELAYELYGEEVLAPWQAKEYHNILIGMPGWSKGGRKRDKAYGRQVVYERRIEEC